MNKERRKTIKVLNEVIAYFFRHHIDDIQIDMHYGEKQVKMMVQGTCPEPPDNLDYFENVLNAPRQVELEDYYWELLGQSGSNGGEMNLLGSLVDCGDVVHTDGKLFVTLYRKK